MARAAATSASPTSPANPSAPPTQRRGSLSHAQEPNADEAADHESSSFAAAAAEGDGDLERLRSRQNGFASHGRGGAGNLASAERAAPPVRTADLTTPVLTMPVVTIGRGGTGNMARNEDAQETRLRQDVEAIPRRSSSRLQHIGRGGAGNICRDPDACNGEETAEHGRPIEGADRTADKQVDRRSMVESLAARSFQWLLGRKQ